MTVPTLKHFFKWLTFSRIRVLQTWCRLWQSGIYTLVIDLYQMEDQTFITTLRNSKSFLKVKLPGIPLVQEAQLSRHGLAGNLKDSRFLVFNWVTYVYAATEKIPQHSFIHTWQMSAWGDHLSKNSTQLWHTSGLNKKQISFLSLLLPIDLFPTWF